MKTSAPKTALVLGAIAVSGLFLFASANAAEDKATKAAERKAKQEAKVLSKYDTNGNGVLDPDELAAKKADDNKAKAERAEKKKLRESAKAEKPEKSEQM